MPIYSQEKLEEINNSGIKINVVISHTAPHFVFPHKKDSLSYWTKLDKNLYKDIDIERNVLSNVFDFLKTNKHPLTKWYYGHFHCNNVEIKKDVSFIAISELNVSKFSLHKDYENEDMINFFDKLLH